jgi:hypothetical protein
MDLVRVEWGGDSLGFILPARPVGVNGDVSY